MKKYVRLDISVTEFPEEDNAILASNNGEIPDNFGE